MRFFLLDSLWIVVVYFLLLLRHFSFFYDIHIEIHEYNRILIWPPARFVSLSFSFAAGTDIVAPLSQFLFVVVVTVIVVVIVSFCMKVFRFCLYAHGQKMYL